MTLLLAFLFMLLTVAAMAIGVMFGRAPIKGSCGGLAQLGLGQCEVCGGDPARCDTQTPNVDRAGLGYDATAPRSSAKSSRLM